MLATLAGIAILLRCIRLDSGRSAGPGRRAGFIFFLCRGIFLFTIGALGLFLIEMPTASRGLRLEALKCK